MAKLVYGTCHICGNYGRLSFEHVPPRAAFNSNRILHTAFDKVLASATLDRLSGEYRQKGAGAYTLCIRCNNDTGRWYGSAYASWAHQAMRFVIGGRGRLSLIIAYQLFPLRVLKQIVCMFFSVNGPRFHTVQQDLVRFVLNPKSKELPPHVRIYAFYTFGNRSRAAGVTGLLRGLGSRNSTIHVFSEITFPPFGFVMTLGDTPPPTGSFCEISGFSQFDYGDWRTGISMRLPLMPIYTGFPGDYRTREQTITDLQQNLELQTLPAGGS